MCTKLRPAKKGRDGSYTPIEDAASEFAVILVKHTRRVQSLRQFLASGMPSEDQKQAKWIQTRTVMWKVVHNTKNRFWGESFLKWLGVQSGFQCHADQLLDLDLLVQMEATMTALTDQYVRCENASAQGRLLVVKGLPPDWACHDVCLFFEAQGSAKVAAECSKQWPPVWWVIFQTCEEASAAVDLTGGFDVTSHDGVQFKLSCSIKQNWAEWEFKRVTLDLNARGNVAPVIDVHEPENKRAKLDVNLQKPRPKPSCAPHL